VVNNDPLLMMTLQMINNQVEEINLRGFQNTKVVFRKTFSDFNSLTLNGDVQLH